jgi:hypothetical protein
MLRTFFRSGIEVYILKRGWSYIPHWEDEALNYTYSFYLGTSLHYFFSEHFYWSFHLLYICFFPHIQYPPFPQPWFPSLPNPSWARLLCTLADQTGDHACPQVLSSLDHSVGCYKNNKVSWFFCLFSRLGSPKDKRLTLEVKARARQTAQKMGRPQQRPMYTEINFDKTWKG